MLFWRMHRASRIVFSLGFHLGRMTPEQCVELLVERGGHEVANAEAEVRRSFNGSYPPLYQLAYMMGGLQFRAREQYHDRSLPELLELFASLRARNLEKLRSLDISPETPVGFVWTASQSTLASRSCSSGIGPLSLDRAPEGSARSRSETKGGRAPRSIKIPVSRSLLVRACPFHKFDPGSSRSSGARTEFMSVLQAASR